MLICYSIFEVMETNHVLNTTGQMVVTSLIDTGNHSQLGRLVSSGSPLKRRKGWPLT
jgi:hypothetical protein